MDVEVVDSRLHTIVPADAELEQLTTGFGFTEGPVWNEQASCLIFSDIYNHTIYRWTEDEGACVVRQQTNGANGNTHDRQGRLLTCEGASRRVVRTELNGAVVTIAQSYQGKRLNSPNDIVVRTDGSIYFTDPNYGLLLEEGRAGAQELPVQGVYRLEPDGSALTLLVDDFAGPNGLAFSPDERLLYVDDSDREHVRVFDVLPDGRLGNGRLFAQIDLTRGKGAPDGLKVDTAGNVYVTGGGGVWIFDPDGTHLGILRVPEVTANAGWGDADYHSLYLTATTSVYRVRLQAQGAGR